jgi:hypothetical protein
MARDRRIIRRCRCSRFRRERFDPVVNQRETLFVDLLCADVRHVSATELGHAVKEHGTGGIAGRHNLCRWNSERAERRARTDKSGFLERKVVLQLRQYGAAGMHPMTMRAIRVQIGTSPSVEIGRRVARLSKLRAFVGRNRRFEKSDPEKLVNLRPLLSLNCSHPIQLVRWKPSDEPDHGL